MSKITIGCDPDSTAHGFAYYVDGVLKDLKCLTLMEVMAYSDYKGDVTIHIENVCGNNATFAKKGVKGALAAHAISRSLGKCQQSQIELERFFEHKGVKVVHHRISKAWKKDKAIFEKLTGWKGRSNEDSRSGAWMGYQGLK